jgi:hypothetical protein
MWRCKRNKKARGHPSPRPRGSAVRRMRFSCDVHASGVPCPASIGDVKGRRQEKKGSWVAANTGDHGRRPHSPNNQLPGPQKQLAAQLHATRNAQRSRGFRAKQGGLLLRLWTTDQDCQGFWLLTGDPLNPHNTHSNTQRTKTKHTTPTTHCATKTVNQTQVYAERRTRVKSKQTPNKHQMQRRRGGGHAGVVVAACAAVVIGQATRFGGGGHPGAELGFFFLPSWPW